MIEHQVRAAPLQVQGLRTRRRDPRALDRDGCRFLARSRARAARRCWKCRSASRSSSGRRCAGVARRQLVDEVGQDRRRRIAARRARHARCDLHQAIVERRRAAQSVSACDVTAFALRPSGASFCHQIDGATATPGRARSLTRAVAVKLPRSLKMRTASPSLIPRAAASTRMEIELRRLFLGDEAAEDWRTTN